MKTWLVFLSVVMRKHSTSGVRKRAGKGPAIAPRLYSNYAICSQLPSGSASCRTDEQKANYWLTKNTSYAFLPTSDAPGCPAFTFALYLKTFPNSSVRIDSE